MNVSKALSKSAVMFGHTFKEAQSKFRSQHSCHGEIQERNVDSTGRDLICNFVFLSEIFIQQRNRLTRKSQVGVRSYGIESVNENRGLLVIRLTTAHLATQSILESDFGRALPRITSPVEIDQ